MELWKTLARRVVLEPEGGRFLRVEEHVVRLPDGRTIDRWPWIETPSYINVVAETEERAFLCFRQPKYAVEGLSLAVTGGYLEPGEDALAAAQRELIEETGYSASEWHFLGRYVVDGNRGAGHAHFYLARGARRRQARAADDLEEQEVLLLSRRQMSEALQQGEFKVLPWAASVAIALLRLQELDA